MAFRMIAIICLTLASAGCGQLDRHPTVTEDVLYENKSSYNMLPFPPHPLRRSIYGGMMKVDNPYSYGEVKQHGEKESRRITNVTDKSRPAPGH